MSRLTQPPSRTVDIVVKAYYGGHSRQLQVPRGTRWEDLAEQLKYEFTLGKLFVKYADEDGDTISLDTQGEFEEALKVAKTTGFLQLYITHTPVLPRQQPPPPPPASTQLKNHYAELARTVGQDRKKMSTEQPQPQPQPAAQRVMRPPEWFTSALDKQTQTIVQDVQKNLDGVVDLLTATMDSSHLYCMKGLPTAPTHFQVECDNCQKDIVGVRYKCGNCPDYDLCEQCETLSDRLHPPDHVFLKIKTPVLVAKDKRGHHKPLLRMNLYRSYQTSYVETYTTSPPVEQPPIADHAPKCRVAAQPYVVKPRDRLREELKLTKQRKKEEKHKRKFETSHQRTSAGLAMGPPPPERRPLEDESAVGGQGMLKLPDIYYDSAPQEADEGTEVPEVVSKATQQKGHGKYLDGKFVRDSCYPDGSVIPIGMAFEKGWVIKNIGTKKWKHVKLVHQVGLKPTTSEVDVPEVKSGEKTKVTVQYPAISAEDPDLVRSSWRLIHKGSTPFGPTLWLSVQVDKEPLHFERPSLPPPPHPAPFAATAHPQPPPLTNTDLLKSIGFLPEESATAPPPTPEQANPPLPVSSDHVEPSAPSLVDILSPPTPPQVRNEGEGEEESFVCVGRYSSATSISSDDLLRTFEMVETPEQSVRSLASNDSLHQPPSLPAELEEDEEFETASHGSCDMDDFVVVIPDCFNLDVPLADYTPLHLRRKELTPTSSLVSHDSHVTSSTDGPQDGEVSEVEILEAPPTYPPSGGVLGLPPSTDSLPRPKPESQPEPESQLKGSPSTARRPSSKFVPQKVTLSTVKASGRRHPFFIATGVMNTLTDLVQEHVRIKPEAEPQPPPNKEDESDNEDSFEDAPEALPSSNDLPEATPTETTPTETTPTEATPITEQIRSLFCMSSNPWVEHQQDVRNLLPSEEDNARWIKDNDVSHLVDRKWEGPHPPQSPVDKLVAMGFANREQNERLLRKHNNQLQSVINELLDVQRGNTHV